MRFPQCNHLKNDAMVYGINFNFIGYNNMLLYIIAQMFSPEKSIYFAMFILIP